MVAGFGVLLHRQTGVTLRPVDRVVGDLFPPRSAWEVRVAGDPQELLAMLVTRARVRHFEVTRPSLHDIFVRIAKPTAEELAQEATHA